MKGSERDRRTSHTERELTPIKRDRSPSQILEIFDQAAQSDAVRKGTDEMEEEHKRRPHRDSDIEGVDYDDIEDRLLMAKLAQEDPVEIARRERALFLIRYVISGSIGVAVAIAGFMSWQLLRKLFEARFQIMMSFMSDEAHQVGAFFLTLIVSLLFAACAVLLVIYVGGFETRGSGVDRLSAYLSGMHFLNYRLLSLQGLLVKMLGLVLSVGSGLKIGLAGPFVHVGAMVAANIRSLWVILMTYAGGSWREYATILKSAADEREFIACGAAAGFTVAFNAPIAAVVLTQAGGMSYFSGDLLLRTLVSCFLAALVLSFLYLNSNQLPTTSLVNPDTPRSEAVKLHEFSGCLTLGVLGGFLAVLYTKINVYTLSLREKYLGTSTMRNLCDVLTLVLLTFLLSFTLPFGWDCQPLSTVTNAVRKTTDLRPFRFGCAQNPLNQSDPINQYWNPMATMWFSVPEDTVRILFEQPIEGSNGRDLPVPVLAVFLVVYFFLAALSYNCAVPGGIFTPSITIGAALGRIIGRGFHHANPIYSVNEGFYGLLGATAVLGGMTRFPLPVCVMMVEVTSDASFLLPIMLTVFIAKLTADNGLSGSLYQMSLRVMEGVETTFGERPHPALRRLNARQIASRPPLQCLNLVDTVGRVLELIRTTRHNAFPVVLRNPKTQLTRSAQDEEEAVAQISLDKVARRKNEEGKYIGLIKRSHLVLLVAQRERWFDTYDRAFAAEPMSRGIANELGFGASGGFSQSSPPEPTASSPRTGAASHASHAAHAAAAAASPIPSANLPGAFFTSGVGYELEDKEFERELEREPSLPKIPSSSSKKPFGAPPPPPPPPPPPQEEDGSSSSSPERSADSQRSPSRRLKRIWGNLLGRPDDSLEVASLASAQSEGGSADDDASEAASEFNQRTLGPEDLMRLVRQAKAAEEEEKQQVTKKAVVVAVQQEDGLAEPTDVDKAKWINFAPFVDQGAYTVSSRTSADRVWKLFARLGMRHVVAINRQHVPVGIITRRDVLQASSFDAWHNLSKK